MQVKVFESRMERTAMDLMDVEILQWCSSENQERGTGKKLQIIGMLSYQFPNEHRAQVRVYYK